MTPDPYFDLSGKIALVTGGSRGLGREMVLAFAERGADVVIASRKIETCEAVAEEVRAMGRRAMEPLGLGAVPPASPVTAASSIDDILAHCHEAEMGFGLVGSMLTDGSPAVEGVTSTIETIQGVDGNDITLYIHRPTDATGPLPGVVQHARRRHGDPPGGGRQLRALA